MAAKKRRQNDRPGQSNPTSFGGARPGSRSDGRRKTKEIQARQANARRPAQPSSSARGTEQRVNAYLRDVDTFLREFKPPTTTSRQRRKMS